MAPTLLTLNIKKAYILWFCNLLSYGWRSRVAKMHFYWRFCGVNCFIAFSTVLKQTSCYKRIPKIEWLLLSEFFLHSTPLNLQTFRHILLMFTNDIRVTFECECWKFYQKIFFISTETIWRDTFNCLTYLEQIIYQWSNLWEVALMSQWNIYNNSLRLFCDRL